MSTRRTVLVADDSRHVVDALAAAFEGAGWTVVPAGDGEEVLRRLASGRPDALLLDLYMPRLNGADLCRLVKAHPDWRRSFLVLMSSRLGEGDEALYRRLGADALLKKPLDAAEVLALVARGVEAAGRGAPVRA